MSLNAECRDLVNLVDDSGRTLVALLRAEVRNGVNSSPSSQMGFILENNSSPRDTNQGNTRKWLK